METLAKPLNLYAVMHRIPSPYQYGPKGSNKISHTFHIEASSHWGAIMESYRQMKAKGLKWFKRPESICYQLNIT